MHSRADFVARYEALQRVGDQILPMVDEVFRPYAKRNRYLYDSRVKEKDSYFQKLETGRATHSDLDDIVACSLIVPTVDDIPQARGALPPAVLVVETRLPAARIKEPDVFRFDELILICMLERAGQTALGPFELQIKTITIHAWSTATHGLVYKGDEIDWRRKRLSAELRAHAEQADLMYSQFLALARQLEASNSPTYGRYRRIDSALERWATLGLWPTEHRPPSKVRLIESISDLSNALDLSVQTLLARTQEWLRKNGHPAGLTTMQVITGIASELVRNWLETDSRHRILVTQDLIDTFPTAAAIPTDRWIELQT